MSHILAIDQGTTSTRAIIFDSEMTIKAVAQEEFAQHYPDSGWVEHDPADLWSSTAGTCRAAIEKAELTGADIAAIGITNQRETVSLGEEGEKERERIMDKEGRGKGGVIGKNEGKLDKKVVVVVVVVAALTKKMKSQTQMHKSSLFH